jgi:hypothetical protein
MIFSKGVQGGAEIQECIFFGAEGDEKIGVDAFLKPIQVCASLPIVRPHLSGKLFDNTLCFHIHNVSPFELLYSHAVHRIAWGCKSFLKA